MHWIKYVNRVTEHWHSMNKSSQCFAKHNDLLISFFFFSTQGRLRKSRLATQKVICVPIHCYTEDDVSEWSICYAYSLITGTRLRYVKLLCISFQLLDATTDYSKFPGCFGGSWGIKSKPFILYGSGKPRNHRFASVCSEQQNMKPRVYVVGSPVFVGATRCATVSLFFGSSPSQFNGNFRFCFGVLLNSRHCSWKEPVISLPMWKKKEERMRTTFS